MANDPNTIQYVIQEDGFWYVASKEKNPYVPELTVSAKGIANGLSTEYNDGWDFGPDSYDPNSTASIPYTQTSGILEAWNYAFSVAQEYSQGGSGNYWMPIIKLLEGIFTVSQKVFLSPNKRIMNPKMIGSGSMSTYVYWNFDDNCIEIDHTNDNIRYDNIEIGYMQPQAGGNVGSGTAFFAAPYVSGDSAYQTNAFQSYDMDFSNSFSGLAMFNLTGFQKIICYNLQAYNGGSYGPLYCDNVGVVAVYGGVAGNGAYISNVSYAYLDFAESLNTLNISNVSILILPAFGIYNGIGIHGNTGIIQIINCSAGETSGGGNAALLNLASGVSSATVEAVIIDYFNGGYAQAYKLANGSITVNNVRVHNVELVSGASLSGDWENIPTTPSVPASATAQQNTNPYPVDVYIYGGDVTEIQITRNGTAYTVLSVSTAIAMAGQAYKLNPGDSITITYSTAPSWEWLSD